MSNCGATCIGVVLFCVVSWILISLGMDVGQSAERTSAIKAGAAEWHINPVTGEKRFAYKVQP